MTHKDIDNRPSWADAQLQVVIDACEDGILMLDERGEIIRMNRQLTSLWQLPESLLPTHENIRATDIFAYFSTQIRSPEICRQWQANDWSASNISGKAHDLIRELTLNDGRCIKFRSHPIQQDGRQTGCILFFTDITRHKTENRRLKLIANAFSHAHEGIVITDFTGKIIDVNAAFSQITGYAREEAIGKNPRILKSGQHNDSFYKTMWKKLIQTGYWQGEVWNRRKNGKTYAQRLSITAIQSMEACASPYYIAFTSDITESKRQQQQLERMAHYDALTDIPNRVLLADRLHQAIAHARRNQNELALVYLDLDGFKEINDTHGHETGDQLLVAIAHRLRTTLRESDTLARLGGDEFIAVLSDLKKPNECEAALSRLLAVANTPFEIGQHTLQLSISIGAALFPHDGEDAETLTRRADQAMYRAKQAGKNQYHLYDSEKDDIQVPGSGSGLTH
ncbi:diguanylate cyclase domain-containing protein [Dentiradicibacter hellwigii]|uniref:Diguanylate cyclase n=1 Tax=Dentiradicibacter hellwigii TaxID=3149053 RepID=A0ABV4UF95_9RHOO